MGSGSSKVAKVAAGAAKRQYPQRVPLNKPPASAATSTPAHGPIVHSKAPASRLRDEAISRDAADPDFARSLRSIGPVQPSPTFSNSSTFKPQQVPNNSSSHPQMFPSPATNPAIQIVEARTRLAKSAEDEFAATGRKGAEGREFLDVVLIRQVLALRDEKRMEPREIERRLDLKSGVVARLGRRGVVGDVATERPMESDLY